MKKLYKYIVLSIGIVAFLACTDETEFPNVVEEGNDVTLCLNVKPEIRKEIVNSRATPEENKLYDLHFYVFNESTGELTGYEKITVDDAEAIVSPTAKVEIRTKTGSSLIYAVANICEGDTYYLKDDDTENVSDKDKLDLCATSTLTYTTKVNENTNENEHWYVINTNVNVAEIVESAKTNLDLVDFNNIKFYRYLSGAGQNFSPKPLDNHYMMSGYLNDGDPVNIQIDESGKGTIAGGDNVLKLYRILAKNTLTISSSKFTPKSYTFYNLPRSGKLVPKAGLSKANQNSAYITNNTTDFETPTEETLLEETTYTLRTSAKEIEFFYPENLQSSSETITQWKDRETNSYDSETGKKSFDNAPLNAAYLEIQGTYEDENTNTSAEVTYTIHLGHFNASKLNDFNVIRNNHYIYTVTINGVEDIKVEATTTSDSNVNNDVENPYAEGLVIEVGGGLHYSVDAHYEARVMRFTKSSIESLKGNSNGPGYILNFTTPFGNTKKTVNIRNINGVGYIYGMDGEPICTISQMATETYKSQLFDGELDFKWMKFVRNTSDNTDAINGITGVCEYPGDGTDSDRQWLTVYELLAELYYTGDDDVYEYPITENGKSDLAAYYTCFIDENYYPNRDWIDYVNKDPRTMQIANDLKVSDDGKSIYAKVAYSISQQSIATFYTDNNKTAFGTEIIDEEDRYNIRLGSSDNIAYYENLTFSTGDTNDWSGFSKTKNTNKNRAWYGNETGSNNRTISVVNTNSIEPIQPMYLSAAKACMSRNRDTNGDGNIDDGEVKWYLASIEQYHALYFAQDVLPEESRFINVGVNGDMAEMQTASRNWAQSGHDFRGKYHYYTSSTRNEAGTYWPEEGLTSNPVQRSNSFMCRAELVRCVRTLENGTLNDPGNGLGCPDRYYDFDPVNETFGNGYNKVERIVGGTFTINSMDAGIRQNINGALPLHNELLDQNKLPRKFQVATTLVNETNHNVNTITGQVNDPCSGHDEGGFNNWRTPNQKEVALMLAHMKDQLKIDQCITRTRFSCYNGDNGTESWYDQSKPKYSWHNRVGFKVNGDGNFNLVGTGDTGKIRCVRDVN